MGRKKLFLGPAELIEGYGLNGHKYKSRRIYLIGKPLASGSVSLVFYGRNNGQRVRVSTGKVLEPEHTPMAKRANEEKVRLLQIECDMKNAELERKEAGFAPTPKNKASFIEYLNLLAMSEYERTGNKKSYYNALKALAMHIEAYSGAEVKFKDITLEWVQGFLEHLKRDAMNFNYLRTDDPERRREVHISQNSQCRLQRNLNFALNKAVKAKIIPSNPMDGLDTDEKVKPLNGTRYFLTEEEVKLLINTPYNHGRHHIKQAFLFSCYTGLRFSDLKRITMSDFHLDKNGTYLKIVMQKTKEPLKVYVPSVAMQVLPDVADDETPVFSLPKNETANTSLRKWLKDAGITDRPITFHSARHSAATLLLSNNVPLAVVSKQLGHLKSSTTEIYAKIVDEAQKVASSKMDDLFTVKND